MADKESHNPVVEPSQSNQKTAILSEDTFNKVQMILVALFFGMLFAVQNLSSRSATERPSISQTESLHRVGADGDLGVTDAQIEEFIQSFDWPTVRSTSSSAQSAIDPWESVPSSRSYSRIPTTTIVPTYAGLINDGNTCCLNSVVNHLFSMKEIREALQRLKSQNIKDNPISTALRSTFIRLDMIRSGLDGRTKSAIQIPELLDATGLGRGLNPHRMQQDASEILIRIEQAIIPVLKEYSELIEFGELEKRRMTTEKGIPVRKKPISETTLCTMLQLSVPHKVQKTSLEKLLSKHTISERTGSSGNNYVVQRRIETLPQYFVINIKRTLFKQGHPYKSDATITYPSTLYMRKYMSKHIEESTVYNLHSMIIHDGLNPGSGHYYCVCKEELDNGESRWIKFNDDLITFMTEAEVLESFVGGENPNGLQEEGIGREARLMPATAHILVYKRIPFQSIKRTSFGLRRVNLYRSQVLE